MTGLKLRSDLTNIQVIATGRSVRALARLRRLYGKGLDEAWDCIGDATTAIETTGERWYEAEVLRVAGEDCNDVAGTGHGEG